MQLGAIVIQYAPVDQKRRPLWKHFVDAPDECPWKTGKTLTVDQTSARQFMGQQESPLHFKIKNTVAEILEIDPNARDIKVEKYIIEDKGRRRPDVFCIYNEKAYAFEIQLAFTQIPIILDREDFYVSQGISLIWLTWNFEEKPFERINQSFIDIYYSHSQNLFSLNDNLFDLSRRQKTLLLQSHAYREGNWRNELVKISDLKPNKSGLPYFCEPPKKWEQQIKERWIGTFRSENRWKERREILQVLLDQFAIMDSPESLEENDFPDLLDIMCSLEAGYPTNSDQNNLTELSNTFLHGELRKQYTTIFVYSVKVSGHKEILERLSVKKKITEGLKEPQVAKSDIRSMVLRKLFPDW